MCTYEKNLMADIQRTFLDASDRAHNGRLLLGTVKTAGGKGGGKGGKGGDRGRVKFSGGMLAAR